MFFLGFVKQRLDALGENVFLFLQSVDAFIEEFDIVLVVRFLGFFEFLFLAFDRIVDAIAFFSDFYNFFGRGQFAIGEFLDKRIERRSVA